MHHSVQKEWIFYTKQLKLAKYYYKHFQLHSIEVAGNVLDVALELSLDTALPALEHLAQHSSAHLRDIQLRIA